MRTIESLRDEIKRLEAELQQCRDGITHMEEYWNRDQNEKAMADALWHIIEVCGDLLPSPPEPEQP